MKEIPPAAEHQRDYHLPFLLENANLRGRFVHLSCVIDTILSKHKYPKVVGTALAEMITLAVLLSSMLKFKGIFTLQTNGKGPLSMMVADITDTGNVRGFANFKPELMKKLSKKKKQPSLRELVGEGYLAFTVDQGIETHRYQGIVALEGENLSDCVRHYFKQSEQLATEFYIAVEKTQNGWQSGAISLQQMPDDETGIKKLSPQQQIDYWDEAKAYLMSCTSDELLNPELGANDILWRLFNQIGVRIFPGTVVKHGCRCSRQRVSDVLRSLPRQEISELKQKGKVIVSCEFCNSSYEFTDNDLNRVYPANDS